MAINQDRNVLKRIVFPRSLVAEVNAYGRTCGDPNVFPPSEAELFRRLVVRGLEAERVTRNSRLKEG